MEMAAKKAVATVPQSTYFCILCFYQYHLIIITNQKTSFNASYSWAYMFYLSDISASIQKVDKMKVLFICNNNVARSQMAEAIFNSIAKKSVATSAGIDAEANGFAGKEIDEAGPKVVKVMLANGFDIRKKESKQLNDKMLEEADIVVFMADKGRMPKAVAAHKNLIVWDDLPDPRFKGYDAIAETFEAVKKHVLELVKQLGNAV